MKSSIVFSIVMVVSSLQAGAAADVVGKTVGGINDKIMDQTVLKDQLKGIRETTPAVPDEVLEKINQNIDQLDSLAENSLNPLRLGSEALQIMTTQGETIFVEVEVEDGWRAIEREWLVTIEDGDLELLKKLAVEIEEEQQLSHLGMTVVRFKIPKDQSEEKIRGQLPDRIAKQLGRNHVYEASSTVSSDNAGNGVKQSTCKDSIKVGMIDTAINEEHAAFETANLTQRNFMQKGVSVPKAHGTAVAGLLVGKDQLVPLLPQSQLYAASVFYPRNKYSQGATLMHLIKALDWLLGENVSVINMSLTGPDNPLLQAAISQVVEKNIGVIAAAGNEGPAASPRYPAAYEGVIAATAVDSANEIYRWANQGEYVDFSALGVAIKTARMNNEYGYESGTSMATPIVTAKIACQLQQAKSIRTSKERLQQEVIDLGEPGKDRIYGYGKLE
ncbi:S8 family serine peptidase [Kangiella marina]|uniref:Peptidase S8/S53 domain-containing protein n=1 Tax=Kangiella marina TaxID=1079178 RepID=A0ABP8IK70_9GAMM